MDGQESKVPRSDSQSRSSYEPRQPFWIWLLIGWIATSVVSGAGIVVWQFDVSSLRMDRAWQLLAFAFQVNAWHLALLFLWPGLRTRKWDDREAPFWRFLILFPLPPLLVLFTQPLFGPIFQFGWRAVYVLPGPLELIHEGAGLLLYFGLALPVILGAGFINALMASLVFVYSFLEKVELNDFGIEVGKDVSRKGAA